MKLRPHLARWAGIAAGYLVLVWICLPRPPLLDGIPFSRKVMDRNGTVLWMSLSRDQKYRIYQPLSGIAPEAIQATLLKEDRFYDFHPGVNPVAVGRSIWQLVSGAHIHSGASTISMQVARLRFHLFQLLRLVSRPAYYYYGLGNEVQLSAEIIPIRIR